MSSPSYELSDEQKAIQDLIRRVARDKVAPRADEIDRTAEYPHDMFELLKGLGLFALPFDQMPVLVGHVAGRGGCPVARRI